MRTFYNKNRIDRAVGAAENASTGVEKMIDSSPKMPWHLRFAGNMKTAAAAVVVGIGLLAGSTDEVQAACDPSVYNVCFHADGRDWFSSGYATLYVDFDVPSGKSSQYYEVEWNGLKKLFNPDSNRLELTYESVSDEGLIGSGTLYLSYGSFWWNQAHGTTTDAPFTKGIGMIQLIRQRVVGLGFVASRLLRWIFTLIKRRLWCI